MPQFYYEVKKGPGDMAKGVLDAENQKAAVARLRELGYFPIKVELHTEKAEKTDTLREALRRITLQERNIFFRQLANLFEAGMILTRALRTLADQTDNPKLKLVINQLREDVQNGSPLADAMEKNPDLFPAMYCSLVRAGETGGMLDEVLWRIVAFGEQEEELRGKAFAAMVYPTFLMIVGSSAIFILVSFVFPKFIEVFAEFNAQLPLPTVITMRVCGFMGTWWWAVLMGIFAFVGGTISYVRKPAGRRMWDGFLLKVPVVRTLVQKYEMAKFARTLGTLLDNGVPILQSLRITANTLGNTLIREELDKVHKGVTDGEAMSESLKRCRFFPPLVIGMFATGEESGRIGAVAKRVADAYDIEVDRAVKALTALFEPLLIVIMGVVVGFLVISMLLPMMTLSASVG